MAEVVQSLNSALESFRGRLHAKAFRGIKIVPKGLNRWWRAGKGNGSKDGGGPILVGLNRSLYSRFSLAEIRAATNDFNNVIGQDSWFRLYKGCMVEGTRAVIIKLYNSRRFGESVSAEIGVQSLTRHPNIVSLIGFCEEKHGLIPVYDYMVNGTLESHLHGSDKDPLLWKKRLEICIGIARGLEYLHTNVEQQFIHCNIKPSNVLLDNEWVAKIGNFEIALPIPTSMASEGVETTVRGTFGYIAPEFFLTGKVTTKIDLYSFGVVLLEVLCAKGPYTPNRNGDKGLFVHFRECIERVCVDEAIDPYLIGKISPECFRHYVNIALSCLANEGIQRPSMKDVLRGLQSSSQMQEAWESSFDMGYELPIANVPRSYNDIISISGEGPILDYLTRSVYPCFWLPGVYPYFWLLEIRAATNDFNEGLLISHGSWFSLYKGFMVRGTRMVMIKRYVLREANLPGQGFFFDRQVCSKIGVQSLTPHPNIVSLIGFCEENDELILMYDYMENGTLKSHLHGSDNDPLLWKKRLEICIDTARGLQYLHTNVEQRFVHHDIKPSNIFLDNDWVAKIVGFEFALAFPFSMATECVETDVCGTLGYWDHEYLFSNKVTKKSDVYAFGVVLLEVLCAKRPYFPNRNWDKVLLVGWFRDCIERGSIDEVIDPYLIGKIAPECFRHYVNIALSCLANEGIRRPSMKDVLRGLQSSS